MVTPIDRLILDFAAGADYITFHPEATANIEYSLQLIREQGCKAGLVLNPNTPLSCLEHRQDKIDVILLMLVVNPGLGGRQDLLPATLNKVGSSYDR